MPGRLVARLSPPPGASLPLSVASARPRDVHAGGDALRFPPPSEEGAGHPVLVPAGRNPVHRPGCCLLQCRQSGLEDLLCHRLPVRGRAEPRGLGGSHLRQEHRQGRAEDVQLVQEAADPPPSRPRPGGGPAE